ncbi:MAG: aminomethyl transferase family protein [Chloroflexaceae bacterium]|nr:aminomethyl transferase family protein [Chloroflexaceae bacterium]
MLDYQTALTGAVVYDTTNAGRIWMRDKDRASLLQRLSTNDIERLQAGQGIRTVLTNHNGRIIDVLTVHSLPDALMLITNAPQRSTVLSLLKKNIFFNDKVKVADASDEVHQLTLYGSTSAALLAKLGAPDLTALPLHNITAATIADVAVQIAATLPLGGGGYTLYIPAAATEHVRTALYDAGGVPLSNAAWEIMRVEAGYPHYPNELSLEYIPLETGLWDAISFNKGCYVGQEIIARMESRNRIAKLLRGLRFAPDAALPPPPHKLSVQGKEAGDLTSVVQSPRYGQIGLAYVRAAHAAPGTQVGLAASDVSATVVALPFTGTADVS